MFLFNTAEPLFEEGSLARIHREEFTTAFWKDANKDGNAQTNEVSVEPVESWGSIGNHSLFSFIMVPMPYKVIDPVCPLLITQPFDVGAEPDPPYITYFLGNDPEGSSVSTGWNGMIRDIASGKTFAEATLLAYTNYFKTINPNDKDKNSQALNSTRLVFFGLPWYSKTDLVSQPQVQLEKTYYRGSNISIPVRNTGDMVLEIQVLKNEEVEDVDKIFLKPDETKNLVLKKTVSDFRWFRLPRKTFVSVDLQTNSVKL